MDNCRVLLVDDEKEFVTTLAERLSMRKMQVKVAHNGEDALAILKEDVPDIVVLDVMMPGMSGLAVLDKIKDRYPDLPVILLTGMGATPEGMEGKKRGAVDYLVKPIDITDLLQRITRAINCGCE